MNEEQQTLFFSLAEDFEIEGLMAAGLAERDSETGTLRLTAAGQCLAIRLNGVMDLENRPVTITPAGLEIIRAHA